MYLAVKECGPVQRVSGEASAEALQLVQQLLSKVILDKRWTKTGICDPFPTTKIGLDMIQPGFFRKTGSVTKCHVAGSVAAPQHRRGAAVALAPHGAGLVAAVLAVAAVDVQAPHGGRGRGAAPGAAAGGDGTVEGRGKRGLVVPQ